MARRIARFLRIDTFIRDRHRHTAATLASILEVSERTVRDDLHFMRDRFHAPIQFDRARGYIYTQPDWRLPTIQLHQGELFALTLGARMLEAYSGSAYAVQLRSAIARLAERLPEQTWVNLQDFQQERISFSSGAQVDLDPEIWRDLERACQGSQTVWMKYFTASRNAMSEREFDPYLLHIYRGTNPYAIGYCHKRDEVRWFRVDRIQKLEVLDNTFVRQASFDPKAHLATIFAHEAGGEPQAVEIWFDAATAPYVRERHWHATQTVETLADGAIVLRMTVTGMNDLKRWVLGYGKGAIVRSPPELVQMVREEVRGMNAQLNNEVSRK